MTASLQNFDIALIIIGLWIIAALLLGPFVGRLLRGPPTPPFEAQGRPSRIGTPESDLIADYVRECEEKRARARARHVAAQRRDEAA